MRVSGKKIAEDIVLELQKTLLGRKKRPALTVLYVGSNPVIENFIRIKSAVAARLGIAISVLRLPESATEDAVSTVSNLSAADEVDGIVVQLPLPPHVNREAVLSAISPQKDIDVISPTAFKIFSEGQSKIMPPTVGAIEEIISRHGVVLENKEVVVVGDGRLVGKPVAAWLRLQGVEPLIVTTKTEDVSGALVEADVIISGAGMPHFIKPDMVKDGVVLIDAGTSEEGGKMRGDIDPACESKASLFTPVPGGVGPITVSILFKNLILTSSHKSV